MADDAEPDGTRAVCCFDASALLLTPHHGLAAPEEDEPHDFPDLDIGVARASKDGTTVLAAHTKDVLSVAFSADNRQIVSGSRDKSIKLWNTLGECKYTIIEDLIRLLQNAGWLTREKSATGVAGSVFGQETPLILTSHGHVTTHFVA